jgi:hypothetical protein
MTGAQIKAFADALVQDTMPDTFFIGAVNTAKDALEAERDWEFLKKLDSSDSHSSGATSTTSHALPSNFGSPIRLTVGDDTTARSLVSYGDSRMLRDEAGYYWIDWANSLYYLTGTQGASGALYFLFKRYTPDIASGTEPVWPAALASIVGRHLAYDVAKAWFAQDQGEREFSWSPEMAAEAARLRSALVTWDERIKAKAVNGSPADMTNAAFIE